MRADPRGRVLRAHAAKLSDAGQRRSGAARALAAGNLNTLAGGGAAMRFLKRRARFLDAQWEPEVGPSKPATRPWDSSGPPAAEVERPLWGWHRRGTLPKAATAKTRAVRQLHNAWGERPRHGLMVSGCGHLTARR